MMKSNHKTNKEKKKMLNEMKSRILSGKKTNLVLGFMLIMLLAMSSNLMSATIYVNYNTGNDISGDGSSGSPYKTFHKGYTETSGGDILDLTGTFNWTNTDETGDVATTGYTLSKNLTIRGQGADETIIQAHASANSADRRVFSIFSSNTVTFRNLTIRYGKVWEGAADPYGGAIAISSGADVTIENCYIHDNYSWQTGGGLDS